MSGMCRTLKHLSQPRAGNRLTNHSIFVVILGLSLSACLGSEADIRLPSGGSSGSSGSGSGGNSADAPAEAGSSSPSNGPTAPDTLPSDPSEQPPEAPPEEPTEDPNNPGDDQTGQMPTKLTFYWSPVTKDTDGTAITVDGYKLEIGTAPGVYDAFITVSDPTATITLDIPGTYFFVVRAFKGGAVGDASNEVFATISPSAGTSRAPQAYVIDMRSIPSGSFQAKLQAKK